jgi:hypothetical protein
MITDVQNYAQSTKDAMPARVTLRHHALMRQLLAGVPIGEAARVCGFTGARASVVVASPLFQAEMKRLKIEIDGSFVQHVATQVDPVRDYLKDQAMESARTVVGLRDNAQSERVRQSSAFDILDRAGYKAPQVQEGKVTLEVSEGLANAIARVAPGVKMTPIEVTPIRRIDDTLQVSGTGTQCIGNPSILSGAIEPMIEVQSTGDQSIDDILMRPKVTEVKLTEDDKGGR